MRNAHSSGDGMFFMARVGGDFCALDYLPFMKKGTAPNHLPAARSSFAGDLPATAIRTDRTRHVANWETKIIIMTNCQLFQPLSFGSLGPE